MSDDERNLPAGVEPLSKDDYFLKATEFRLWLKEEKNKYIDSMSGDDARYYFKRFVKAWNRGKLDRKFYQARSSQSISASQQTSYKWSFASNRSRVDKDQLESARRAVDAGTNLDASAAAATSASSSSGGGRVFGGRVQQGPAMPPGFGGGGSSRRTEADDTLDREEGRDRDRDEKKREKKRAREEEKDSRSGGREGRIEKRRETNASNRQMRDKEVGGLEVDEATLMGASSSGPDSFKSRMAARDSWEAKKDDRRAKQAEERRAAVGVSTSAMKQKNDATMQMFAQMAAQKYGS